MDIGTVQNILLVLALVALALYALATVAQTKPKWFLSQKFLKARQIQQKYDKTIKARTDMLHHYYWSKSNNEKTQMKNHEKQIIKIDQELQDMRDQYQVIREGVPVPLRMF